MKKLILIILIACLLLLAGCAPSAPSKPDGNREIENCRFEYLGITENPYFNDYFEYWRDIYTDVVYVRYQHSNANATTGGFTPLLDSDGTPILWNDIKGEN